MATVPAAFPRHTFAWCISPRIHRRRSLTLSERTVRCMGGHEMMKQYGPCNSTSTGLTEVMSHRGSTTVGRLNSVLE